MERRRTYLPFCDCEEAARSYTGKKPATKYHHTMVPTTVRADGLCAHCGHAVFYDHDQSETMREAETYRRNKGTRQRKARGLKATNLKTGEVRHFEGFDHALREGFPNTYRAVQKGWAVRGWRFERVG